jgi:hypothetical protein
MRRFRLTAIESSRHTTSVCSAICIAMLLMLWTGIAAAGSLIATWNANQEDDLAGYIVCYGTTSGAYTTQTDVGNETVFVAEGLNDGQEYYFAVKAYDFSGNTSMPSTEVSARVGDPALVALKDNQTIKLVWTPIAEAESYAIYKSTDPYFTPQSPIAMVDAADHEFVDASHFQNNEVGTYYIVQAQAGGSVSYVYNPVGAYDVELQRGLNLVSLPLTPADSSIHSVIGAQLTGGESSSAADKLRFRVGDEYEVAWLYDGPAETYQGKWISSTTTMESSKKLDTSKSFWVEVENSHEDTVFTVTGSVPMDSAKVIELHTGYNFVGSVYPVEVLLQDSELYDDQVIRGGVGSGEADIIKDWLGEGYETAWVVDGTSGPMDGMWMNETGKAETTISFRPGAGYVIWVKEDMPNKMWTYPNPSIYE